MGNYVLEECSMYTHLQIKNKDVYIFETHNMALPVWGTYSGKYQTEFNLVTFDSHTDTRTPFTAEVISRSTTSERLKIGECKIMVREMKNGIFRTFVLFR